jgi:hypothetical protein
VKKNGNFSSERAVASLQHGAITEFATAAKPDNVLLFPPARDELISVISSLSNLLNKNMFELSSILHCEQTELNSSLLSDGRQVC